jgi:hypothetical protein
MLAEQIALVMKVLRFPRMSLFYLFICPSEMSYSIASPSLIMAPIPLPSPPTAAIRNLQQPQQCQAERTSQALSLVPSSDLWSSSPSWQQPPCTSVGAQDTALSRSISILTRGSTPFTLSHLNMLLSWHPIHKLSKPFLPMKSAQYLWMKPRPQRSQSHSKQVTPPLCQMFLENQVVRVV